MKLSKLFHWLYFFVMALPLVVAPIFAIYSHRHTIDNYTVVTYEPSYVDVHFNQLVINGLLDNNIDNWVRLSGDDLVYTNGYAKFSFDALDTDAFIDANIGNFTFNGGDKILFKCNAYLNYVGDVNLFVDLDDANYGGILLDNTSLTTSDTTYSQILIFDQDVTVEDYKITFALNNQSDLYNSVFFSKVQLFNLTSIFGFGNEPTIDTFNDIFDDDYYDYTLDTLVNIQYGTHNVIYNDSDIGSQFIYSMYNCVDKYFNYDNVVNFGTLYTWLNTTFFSGSAPLGFFIFWHLLEYWLLTSLLWLLFDVLMYVPQLVHRWLDKASIS